MSVITVHNGPPLAHLTAYLVGHRLVKDADDPAVAYNLAGRLYLSPSGWVLLSVPNALVRGIFAAMHEPGVELPPADDGGLHAHVSVFRPAELEQIGGAAKITERGKQFRYTLGRLVKVKPENWPEMAEVWFVNVHSPELMALRRSYGLSSLPNDGRFSFHVTVAVKRRGVLGRNEAAKGGGPAD